MLQGEYSQNVFNMLHKMMQIKTLLNALTGTW